MTVDELTALLLTFPPHMQVVIYEGHIHGARVESDAYRDVLMLETDHGGY